MAAPPYIRNSYDTALDAVVDPHVQGLLSATAPIAYNNGTGVISLTGVVPTANGGITTVAVNTTFYVDPVLGTDDAAHGDRRARVRGRPRSSR